MRKVGTYSQKGFTIVELLIVIVIIGILAVLVVVGINGIQKRAEKEKYRNDASIIVRKASAYSIVVGMYPSGAIDGVPQNFSEAADNALLLPTNIRGYYQAGPTDYATAYTYANMTAHGYAIVVCGGASRTGLTVYYPDPTNSTVASVNAGTCP